MQEKDIIVRFSGEDSKVREAFTEIIEQATELGLIGDDLCINKVPEKVQKDKLQVKSASDIMVKVSADEDKIADFMDELISIVSKKLELSSPSTSIKLLNGEGDE
ncbi:hypothetical protein [Serratia proteamaculans]|uniref:hypothetical protein n=1 Tax=Serratia proteamaculans TaxID=28151 RepID=UPI00217AB18C|nr:hypothetical protein [Serratia proteamaculans]CAI1738563.1 Uncharacterised protein [Serratia proteamaculans]